MNINRQTARIEGDKPMNSKGSTLIRWAGLSAAVAGIFYILIGMFHPANVVSSVTTTPWIIAHIFAIGMSFFGLLGMAGLYARQAEKSGWLGLIGFIMFSLWLVLMTGFTFIEAFILPSLATSMPTFVEGFLGMFSSTPSAVDFGILPTLWMITGPLLILGGLLFGIAMFRAGVLPRWAGALLAIGSALTPLAALLPPEHEPKVLVTIGLAFVWLGYALWSEKRAQAAERLADMSSPQLRQSEAQ